MVHLRPFIFVTSHLLHSPFDLPLPLLRTLVVYTGSIWILQNNLPILTSAHQQYQCICTLNSLPCDLTHAQTPGLGCGHLWRPCSAYHRTETVQIPLSARLTSNRRWRCRAVWKQSSEPVVAECIKNLLGVNRWNLESMAARVKWVIRLLPVVTWREEVIEARLQKSRCHMVTL